MMKSDVDLVGLKAYEDAARIAVSGFFSSSTPSADPESEYNMVPLKQKSSPPTSNMIGYKESDSNGNDIHNDKLQEPEKTDVSSYLIN